MPGSAPQRPVDGLARELTKDCCGMQVGQPAELLDRYAASTWRSIAWRYGATGPSESRASSGVAPGSDGALFVPLVGWPDLV